MEEGSKFRAAEDKKTTLIRGARAFKQFLQDADAKFKDKAPPVKALPALERPKAAPDCGRTATSRSKIRT